MERPSPPQYLSFFQEVSRFLKTTANIERLRRLLSTLEAVDLSKILHVQRDVATWQQTAISFVERLQKVYSLYRDVVQPVQMGIYEILYGLSLMIESKFQTVLGNGLTVAEVIIKLFSCIFWSIFGYHTIDFRNRMPLATLWSTQRDSNFLPIKSKAFCLEHLQKSLTHRIQFVRMRRLFPFTLIFCLLLC